MTISEYKSKREEEIVREIIQWRQQHSDPAYKENETLIRVQYKFFEGDVAKIKKHLMLYSQKRNQVMIEYNRWDRIYENLRDAYDTVIGGLLPQKNPSGHSVMVVKMLDYSKDLNLLDGQMRALLLAETIQEEHTLQLGKKVVVVLDYTGVHLSYVFRLNIFALQKMYNTWKEFAFLACSEIHHINLPLHSYYIINLANYILDEKLKKKNYYHTGNLTQFYEHVPQEILPKEYGGNAPELKELSEIWYNETIRKCGPAVKYFQTLAENSANAKKQAKRIYNPFKFIEKIIGKSNAERQIA